jgi:hypothetical protein|tara:strand:+ start:449 stop:1042 length:594 start_codon:yes stop_codon:yes gene_type:complete
MKLHVLKANVSNVTRSMMAAADSAEVNGQAKAFKGLTAMLFSKENVETLILKALIHRALRHRVSYFVNHDDTEAALRKVFEVENAPFEVEGIWCLERRGKSASLSVGDIVIVEKECEWDGVKTTRPQIWLCQPVGWKELGEDMFEAFFEAELCPRILCEDRDVSFRRMPRRTGKGSLPVWLEADFVINYEREIRETA